MDVDHKCLTDQNNHKGENEPVRGSMYVKITFLGLFFFFPLKVNLWNLNGQSNQNSDSNPAKSSNALEVGGICWILFFFLLYNIVLVLLYVFLNEILRRLCGEE